MTDYGEEDLTKLIRCSVDTVLGLLDVTVQVVMS